MFSDEEKKHIHSVIAEQACEAGWDWYKERKGSVPLETMLKAAPDKYFQWLFGRMASYLTNEAALEHVDLLLDILYDRWPRGV